MIDQMDAWQRWWSGLDGTPGEIVWDSADSDLDADLDIFAPHFDPQLPVIDLGCGDGRQTRRLARHFATVVGVDIAPAAVELARGVDNPSHVCFRVLDTRSTHEAEHIHREFGPANVYVRGVLQALPPADRPAAANTIRLLLGEAGTLFAKELPPAASAYFAAVASRHGMPPTLARVMRLIPPGQITEDELGGLFPSHRFTMIGRGTSQIRTVNALPDGEAINVPAIWLLLRARMRSSRPEETPVGADRRADREAMSAPRRGSL